MRRTDRLFEILQMFRSGKLLLARDIADRLDVSVRTIYRDIDSLVASGLPIEGERGVGYQLREPIFLPPLALTHSERHALRLGVEIVAQVADKDLADAAEMLLAKLEPGIPSAQRRKDLLRVMSVYASISVPTPNHLGIVRQAIVDRRVLTISYSDESDRKSRRRIWPLQTEYWGRVWTCAAWCELRDDFRSFRVDRLLDVKVSDETFPETSGRRYIDYLATVVGKEEGS